MSLISLGNFVIAVFSRIRGNKILERFTVQDCNTPHSCDYRYNDFGNDFYNLHTLIRHYLGDKLEESEFKNEVKRAYCKAMVDIARQIPQIPVLEDIATFEPLIDHLKIATEELNQWLEDDDLAWPFVGLGRFYQGQGLYSVFDIHLGQDGNGK